MLNRSNCNFVLSDAVHGMSSSAMNISQSYMNSSSSTPHHQHDYQHKRSKSVHSINSSSLHRRGGGGTSVQSRSTTAATRDAHRDSGRGN